MVLISSGCVLVSKPTAPPLYPVPQSWNEKFPDSVVPGKPDLRKWWTVFNDPKLNELIKTVIDSNLDLREAVARIRESRVRRTVARGDFFPDIDAIGSYARRRSSANSTTQLPAGTQPEDKNLYATGVEASWEIDVFRRIRNSVAAAEADVSVSREDYRDVLVSLIAEAAINYVDLHASQKRLDIANTNIVAQKKSLELARQRVEAGASPALDVAQALSNLADTESVLPGLRIGLQRALNRLSILSGVVPGAFDETLSNPRPIPQRPEKLVIDIPAGLIHRRPDIRRAQQSLAAQAARVGVAKADLYPKFLITGTIGLEATKFEETWSHRSRTYGFGPSFRWNLTDGGRTRSEIQIQDSLLRQAVIRYESSVLLAIEEVEDAILAYREEQIRHEALKRASTAAQESVELAQQLYKAGQSDFQNVLDAQRSLLAFQDRAVVSESNVIANLISLYKALGGGWDESGEADFTESIR